LDEAGGTRHHELARHLVSRGHQVTVIASPVSYLTGKVRARVRWVVRAHDGPAITFLRTYTYPALHRSFIHRVFSFLSFMVSSFIVGLGVRRVDLVWGTSPPIFQGITAWLLARLKRARFIFEVRDLWPAFAVAVGVLRSRLLIGASEWLERFLYRRADRVMVNSPGYIEHVSRRGARQVSLVPNGADPSMFDPAASGEEFRRAHALAGRFVALYAGAHGLSNDLGVVLQAAARLKEHPEIIFVLVGDGKDKPALQQQALDAGIGNVRFVPPVAKQAIPAVLAAADACIAILKPVELYKTTYPNKVFDYMAAGRPVILAIDGVIRQVVEGAGAGIAVPPGDAAALADAVLRLAGDRPAAQRMGLNGRNCIERDFSRSTLADQLCQVLERT
jgi:glycosyltransferase involved in cell wall biosynthesis